MAAIVTPIGNLSSDAFSRFQAGGTATTVYSAALAPNYCQQYAAARRQGQAPAIIEALRRKCVSSALRSGASSAGQLAPSDDGAVAAFGEDEARAGIPPAVIAAGVVCLGVLAYALVTR